MTEPSVWLPTDAPSLVKPSRTNARLARDLPTSPNPRWYTFEVGYGEWVPVTVPVHLVPAWVDRRRLRRVLRLFWWPPVQGDLPEEGAWVRVCEDICPGEAYSLTDEEVFQINYDLAIRHGIQVADEMFGKPLVPGEMSEKARGYLRGYTDVVGTIADARGGALLRRDHLWCHEQVQDWGLLAQVQRLLGIK